ncbi:ECF transporter S component [Facklamia lactis]|uniref:ECF transporter S component n=1 Tax=Facklamia lactis TaxID=2749967 RepID=UPI0018CFADBA|nr:ECF transporter S component [Facklamia lactis]MBG9979708.1 ECF transporter S component [Facklamia lactis]
MSASMSSSSYKTKKLVILSIFMAIILLQTWVPFLGYIAIPPLSITIIHVTVIVATLWLGTKEGVLIGTFWGINSLIRAYLMPTSPMYIYVFSSPLVSVLPRILMPLIVGWSAHVKSKHMTDRLRYMIHGGLGSVLNTVLVLGAIAVFKRAEYLQIQGASLSNLWKVLGGIILINGIPEMIFSIIVTPIIMMALRRANHQ